MAGLPPRDAPAASVADHQKIPPRPNSGRRRRRLVLLCIVIFLIPALLWFSGIATAVLNDAVARAISRDYESAETWLKTLAKLRSGNVETVFLSARLARKELRLAEVPERLKQYMDLGGSRELARREYLLLESCSPVGCRPYRRNFINCSCRSPRMVLRSARPT